MTEGSGQSCIAAGLRVCAFEIGTRRVRRMHACVRVRTRACTHVFCGCVSPRMYFSVIAHLHTGVSMYISGPVCVRVFVTESLFFPERG